MKVPPTLPVDARGTDALVRLLRARAPGYVPEVTLGDGTADGALAAVFAGFAHALLTRLNQAPDKGRLSFFNLLGIEPTPARAARTAVVFQLVDQASASAAPAGTPVAAPPPPGASAQVVFETETSVGLVPGRVAQVVSLWPGRDSFIDHSLALSTGNSFRAFARDLLQPVEHAIYLSHDKLLALSGSTRLLLEWELAIPGSKPLEIGWEYWDGKTWREFLELNPSCRPEGVSQPDGTAGLSRNGRVELRAEGAAAEKIEIAGVEGYWVRGRVLERLPPDRGFQLPEVDAIRISSTVEQALTCAVGLTFVRDERYRSIQVVDEAGLAVEGAGISLKYQDAGMDKLVEIESSSDGAARVPAGIDLHTIVELGVRYLGVGGLVSLSPDETWLDPSVSPKLSLSILGLDPDAAVGEGSKLDVTKPFFPFGQQPGPGAAFYLMCDEALAKAAGRLRIYLPLTQAPLNQISSSDTKRVDLIPQIIWEYWNGRAWAVLVVAPGSLANGVFKQSEVLDLLIPSDVEPRKVNDTEGLWIRARLLSGGFGYTQEVSWEANEIAYVVHQPPVVAATKLGYSWQQGPFHPDHVLSFNDFEFREHTEQARWPGSTFAAFRRVADETAALYIGFDRKPPTDVLGLFLDIEEQPLADLPPELTWEYWNGSSWQALLVQDETQHLRFPAIASVVAQGDSAALSRFGRALHWVRARAKRDLPPAEIVFGGLYPNAVWASQQRTLRDLAVGQGNGSLNQRFTIAQVPILPGERIEVRELFGPRAAVEWRNIALELFTGDRTVVQSMEEELAAEGRQTDVERGPLRLRRDRLKRINEVWVQWQWRPSLLGAGEGERCYVLDRATGMLRFGDGRMGRVVPAGAAVQARKLQSGGGKAGNVEARSLAQLQADVPGVEAVFNPRAAEGGADGEPLESVQTRAPNSLRHRGRAIDLVDYETLAREASATVAFARAIPTCSLSGRVRPGCVSVIIIPHSVRRQPSPSVFLREQVQQYLAARAPAELGAGGISVIGPNYLPIDVSATLAPREISEAGAVERAARVVLERFLHPLHGGPNGGGWDLGRDVYLSDVAAVLDRVPGVDYVRELALLLSGVPQGTALAVGDDRIVVGGTFRLKVEV